MLSVSRVHVVHVAVILSLLVITLTPYLNLGVTIASACTGAETQCGGG